MNYYLETVNGQGLEMGIGETGARFFETPNPTLFATERLVVEYISICIDSLTEETYVIRNSSKSVAAYIPTKHLRKYDIQWVQYFSEYVFIAFDYIDEHPNGTLIVSKPDMLNRTIEPSMSIALDGIHHLNYFNEEDNDLALQFALSHETILVKKYDELLRKKK